MGNSKILYCCTVAGIFLSGHTIAQPGDIFYPGGGNNYNDKHYGQMPPFGGPPMNAGHSPFGPSATAGPYGSPNPPFGASNPPFGASNPSFPSPNPPFGSSNPPFGASNPPFGSTPPSRHYGAPDGDRYRPSPYQGGSFNTPEPFPSSGQPYGSGGSPGITHPDINAGAMELRTALYNQSLQTSSADGNKKLAPLVQLSYSLQVFIPMTGELLERCQKEAEQYESFGQAAQPADGRLFSSSIFNKKSTANIALPVKDLFSSLEVYNGLANHQFLQASRLFEELFNPTHSKDELELLMSRFKSSIYHDRESLRQALNVLNILEGSMGMHIYTCHLLTDGGAAHSLGKYWKSVHSLCLSIARSIYNVTIILAKVNPKLYSLMHKGHHRKAANLPKSLKQAIRCLSSISTRAGQLPQALEKLRTKVRQYQPTEHVAERQIQITQNEAQNVHQNMDQAEGGMFGGMEPVYEEQSFENIDLFNDGFNFGEKGYDNNDDMQSLEGEN